MRSLNRLTPAGSRREADLFFADLVGEAPSPPPIHSPRARPWTPLAPPPIVEDQEDFSEAVPLRGSGRFRHEPLGGVAGNNVEARWNVDAATTASTAIDIVVYLHGYSDQRDDAAFIGGKASTAGVDLVDSAGTITVRATRPTLALVPRGRHATGATWLFDRLADRAAFDALVDAGLSYLSSTVLQLSSALPRGRLTLAAHSGGGAGMNTLLGAGVDPDELICYDSMYGSEDSIRRWADARIASADASRCGLRVFYTGCSAPSAANPSGRWAADRNGRYTLRDTGSWSWRGNAWHITTTEVSARRLQHAIGRALAQATGGAALVNRFRVQRTSVAHSDIPARYGRPLIENIAADVPKASAPPASTSRPACVANDDWLRSPARKPGGDDPPPPQPAAAQSTREAVETYEAVATAIAEEPATTEDAYAPPNAGAYTRNTSAALFRTSPNPVTVTAATEWPQAATDADAASERALRALGVDAAGLRTFGSAGMTALRPIASAFGEAALTELLRRLRYPPARLVNPRHSYNREADLTRAFGRDVPHPVILSMRTLLAVPGHFRELARVAPTEEEAYALENLGWLLMQSLSNEVRTATRFDFWLPASPSFVTPFTPSVTGLSPQATELIRARTLTDSAVEAAAYRARFTAWLRVPGRMWRLETGRDTATGGRAAGAPFYADPFTIPGPINITAERAQVRAAWRNRLADFDAGRTTKPLHKCDDSYLTNVRVIAPIPLGGLQLRTKFPSASGARTLTELNGLAAVAPAFTSAFQAVADLGWNDLLFETQGMGCFRGKKIPGNPAASRNMSEHSLGIAVDLNAFENGQNTDGSMDPRIVALFEAFRFRWGKGFPTPDPMHFEYAG